MFGVEHHARCQVPTTVQSTCVVENTSRFPETVLSTKVIQEDLGSDMETQEENQQKRGYLRVRGTGRLYKVPEGWSRYGQEVAGPPHSKSRSYKGPEAREMGGI